MTAIETIPNAFWSALNNQNLSDHLTPRWSVLVNDSGVQCTLYWESSDNAPPSPPPSPNELFTKGSLPMRTTKRHASQQAAGSLAKRLRPAPSLQSQRNPLATAAGLFNRNVPIGVPQSVSSVLDAAQLKETLEKKFNVNQSGLDQLDTDVCRKNAVSNFTQNLAQQIQLHLNNTNITNNPSKTLSELQQNVTRGNIIRMANTESKSSTPGTDIMPSVLPHANKTVIQSNNEVMDESGQAEDKSIIRPSPDINQQIIHPSSVHQQRGSVVRSVMENGDLLIQNKNDTTTSPDMLTPEGVSSNERRPSKSVISDQMINDTADNENAATRIGDLPASSEATAPQNRPSSLFTNSSERRPLDGEDTDDTNLDMLVKTQAQFNAQHNISSIVQNAAAAAVAAVATNQAQVQQAQQVQQVHHQQQQAAQLQQQLANIQSGHQSIQDQLRAQAQAAAQLQVAQQQAAGQQAAQAAAQAGSSSIGRTQAEILKENLSNLKQEEIDSDCELVEDRNEIQRNSAQNNLTSRISHMQQPQLRFDPPTSLLSQQRPTIGTITGLNTAFSDIGRPVVSSSSTVIGNRIVSGNSRVPATSVDTLAEQNGHKAELQALRQEARRGDELSMSRFVRTLSKIIFEPGELMVDSVKDIDKNKIAILLAETQQWYRANMAEVRQTLSIRLSEIRKSKRAAHWQTGRAQVMTGAWPPQFQTQPRYMNDSRYFPLSNPITGLDARRQNQLALADTPFAHISEMD